MGWFERAEESIEAEYEYGSIDEEEYNRQMRDLQAELEASAQEEADDAYKNVMGR